MSLLQWNLGHLNVSFEQDVPVPSYISFEKQGARAKLAPESDDEDNDYDVDMLQGGARKNWENIYNRYRVVGSAEITENVNVGNVNVDFQIAPNRPGQYGVENMPLPRQVVLAMVDDMAGAVKERFSENRWEQAVRDVTTRMRGFDAPLQVPFQGPGEQKWVVKRMRDLGPMTAEQRHELEVSQGRIKTNMFWLAQRQWEFVQAVLNMDLPEVRQILRPNVLDVLEAQNLPTKAKDVLPRHYPMLFEESWLRHVQPADVGSDSEGPPPPPPPSPQPPPLLPTETQRPLGRQRRRMFDVPPGAVLEAVPEALPVTGNVSGNRSVLAALPARRSSERGGNSSSSSSRRSVGRDLGSSSSSPRAEEEQAPIIEGGDSLSSETGRYRGVLRWQGPFQGQDNFNTAAGYEQYMHKLFEKHRRLAERKAPQSPIFAYILQTINSTEEPAVLHPLLYLLENDMFAATLSTLRQRQMIESNFNEEELLQLCNNSWLELKPGETFNLRSIDTGDVFEIKRDYMQLFDLKYTNANPQKPNVTQLAFSGTRYSKEAMVNYLPVILYQIVTSPICHDQVEFLNWKLLDSDVLLLVKTVFGQTHMSTKQKLKQHLLSLQDDLGFFKLNKPGQEYFNYTMKSSTIMLVFSVKPPIEDVIHLENIETWITGYIINDTNKLIYNIEKQQPDIRVRDMYPWMYATRTPSVFQGQNHLKIELICRRKLKPDLQGVGFTLMAYFLSHFRQQFVNLSMVLMDVTRVQGDQGLPDPMFSQLLHERFKFQRTFEFEPLLQSPSVLNLPPEERNQTMNDLNNTFVTQNHAPYLKTFTNRANFSAGVIQREFVNLLPQNIDLQNLQDPDVQQTLHSAAKYLTFARPMPDMPELASIYQRFYQSLIEKKKHVALGELDSF